MDFQSNAPRPQVDTSLFGSPGRPQEVHSHPHCVFVQKDSGHSVFERALSYLLNGLPFPVELELTRDKNDSFYLAGSSKRPLSDQPLPPLQPPLAPLRWPQPTTSSFVQVRAAVWLSGVLRSVYFFPLTASPDPSCSVSVCSPGGPNIWLLREG